MNEEVKVYTTSRKIGEHLYAEQICARSLQEARETAAKFGATVDGELVGEICAVCGNSREVKPTLGADEWPDTVE
jgi:hypothetical protein